MRLHKDGKAFRLLLDNIHERTGYRTDVLEKDYYVVLILQELAGFQGLHQQNSPFSLKYQKIKIFEKPTR